MIYPEKATNLSTMNSGQLFTLWLEEKWVRNLVILLSPVGLVDAIYTVLLFGTFGAGYEYNPIVRAALQSQWWFLWFLIDAVSFSLFAMMGGSYYVHTRRSPERRNIGLVSGLIGVRVGLAVHNVLRFYGVFPAVFGGFLVACLTYLFVDNLLDRENAVSWQGTKQWFRHKYDRYHDHRLVESTKGTETGAAPKKAETETSAGRTSPWRKRLMYLLAAIVIFFAMPFVLIIIGVLTGVTSFSDIYGPLVFFNQLSAPAFLIAFFTICIFTALIMYLILKSFEVTEGAW